MTSSADSTSTPAAAPHPRLCDTSASSALQQRSQVSEPGSLEVQQKGRGSCRLAHFGQECTAWEASVDCVMMMMALLKTCTVAVFGVEISPAGQGGEGEAVGLGAAHDGAEPALHHVGGAGVVVHPARLYHLPRQQVPLLRRVLWSGCKI